VHAARSMSGSRNRLSELIGSCSSFGHHEYRGNACRTACGTLYDLPCSAIQRQDRSDAGALNAKPVLVIAAVTVCCLMQTSCGDMLFVKVAERQYNSRVRRVLPLQ